MVLNRIQSKQAFMAFHGDPALKASCLERLRSHVRRDEIAQGVAGWTAGKGGVIGCTVHSNDRCRYEPDLGIPAEVASLEEIIFERLPEEEAKRFSLEFLEAVPVAADLSFVWPAIAQWLLTDPERGIIRFAQTAETRAAIQRVADLYARVLRCEPVSPQQFRDAVQIAGPLGEGIAAQVVSGAAEAVSDPIQITAWTVGRACSVAPEEMWPAIKSKLLDLVQSARAHRSPARSRQLRLAAAS
jgi:hypothetical protein